MKSEVSFVLHVNDECANCLAAMALLEHYCLSYEIKSIKCQEWATWPAVYVQGKDGLELLGGYDQLINFIYDMSP